jgi:anti-sigma factor RsiW
MNCQEVDQSLAAYLHGEVGRSERELIRAHIAQCQRCQAELSRLSELQADVSRSLHARADSASPSPVAWARLQASLAPHRQPTLADRVKQTFSGGVGNWVAPRTLMFLASAVIASVVALSLVALPPGGPLPQPQPTRDAVATLVPDGAPSVPGVVPAAPLVVPATQPNDARRVSGPIDDANLLAQPLTDAPVTVLDAPNNDVSIAPAAAPASAGAGGWVVVRNPALESAPYRACTRCSPFE